MKIGQGQFRNRTPNENNIYSTQCLRQENRKDVSHK